VRLMGTNQEDGLPLLPAAAPEVDAEAEPGA